MKTPQEMRALLASSSIANLHQVRVGRESGTVECVIDDYEVGANLRAHPALLCLLALAASHGVSDYPHITHHSYTLSGHLPRKGDRVIALATLLTCDEERGIAVITVKVRSLDRDIATVNVTRSRNEPT